MTNFKVALKICNAIYMTAGLSSIGGAHLEHQVVYGRVATVPGIMEADRLQAADAKKTKIIGGRMNIA